LYTLGARLVEMFPQVPLLENTGLCVALVSYDGRLFWGFNADPEMVPDLPNFARAITSSFVALRDAARLHPVAVRSTEPATPAETAAKARKARRQRPRPAGGRDTRAAS